MKKTLYYLAMFCVVCLFAVSCETEETPPDDESFLIGKWVSGTLYYKYLADGNGETWDTADDVNEGEGTNFEWSLINTELPPGPRPLRRPRCS